MSNQRDESSVRTLSMDTEAFYRKQAASYRGSAEYMKMKRLYPLLESHIEYCRGEELIN